MTNILLYKHNISTELTKVMQLVGDIDYAALKENSSWLVDYVLKGKQLQLLVYIDKFVEIDDAISTTIALPFVVINVTTDVPLYVILEKSEQKVVGVVTEEYLNRHYTKFSKKATPNKKEKVEENKSMKKEIMEMVKELVNDYGCMICPCSTTIREVKEMAKYVNYSRDIFQLIEDINTTSYCILLTTSSNPIEGVEISLENLKGSTVVALFKRAEFCDKAYEVFNNSKSVAPKKKKEFDSNSATNDLHNRKVAQILKKFALSVEPVKENDCCTPLPLDILGGIAQYQSSKDLRQELIQKKIASTRPECSIPIISKTDLDKILESTNSIIQPPILISGRGRVPGVEAQRTVSVPKDNRKFEEIDTLIKKIERVPHKEELTSSSKKVDTDIIVPELDDAAWNEIYKGISNTIYNDIINARKRGEQIAYISSIKYPLPQEIIDAYVNKGYRIVLTRTPKGVGLDDYVYDFEMVKGQKAEYVEELK